MLLDTLVDFFKQNHSVIAAFIKACYNIATLPDNQNEGILFDDVIGAIYSESATLAPEICSSILDLKKLSLNYLLKMLEHLVKEKRDLNCHMVPIALMIEKLIENSGDKALMLLVLKLCDIVKLSVNDQFFIHQLDEYLDDNLFQKYYSRELVSEKEAIGLSLSKFQSAERWKLLRSVSLRSPSKRGQTFTPLEPVKTLIDSHIEIQEDSSLQTSQPGLAESATVLDFNLEEIICDGSLL